MTLQTWMETRKMILLTEKRNILFTALPKAPNFNFKRKELYDVLSRIEQYKRETHFEPRIAVPSFGIPMLA